MTATMRRFVAASEHYTRNRDRVASMRVAPADNYTLDGKILPGVVIHTGDYLTAILTADEAALLADALIDAAEDTK